MKLNENLICLLLLTGAIIVFFVLNRVNENTNFVDIGLDHQIPFIPATIVVYYSFYPIWILSMFYMLRLNKLKTMAMPMLIAFLVSYLVYILYPTAVLRQSITTNDVFSQMLQSFYSMANPVNVLPSLHVSLIVLTFVAVYNQGKKFGKILLPVTILIILSTLFTKLHYMLDVVAGIFVSVFSYLVYVKFLSRKMQRHSL